MIEELQRWLALEHEAVWLYGLIGGRFDDLRDGAATSWNEHRATRDRLTELIRRHGESPVGPALSYGTPIAIRGRARAAARALEQRIATASLVLTADASLRRFAVARLRTAARSAVTWGARPHAFPGLD